MLSETWQQISSELQLPSEISDDILRYVETKYTEPWRFYHTLKHIEELLHLSVIYRHEIKNPLFVNLAIIFHDIEYYVDSRSSENEKQSAITFERVLSLHVPKPLMDIISAAILATKTHVVDETALNDLKLFMDFDMSILGSDREIYKTYAMNIRNEYQAIDKAAYCVGRSGFFRKYLESTANIYSSDYFRSRYETKARENIAWECGILELGELISADS